jgi:coatomer subunit beta'
VLFAQTYKPSRAVEIIGQWKGELEKNGKSKVSKIIAVPGENEDMFPEWDEYLRLEKEGGSLPTQLVDLGEGEEEENEPQAVVEEHAEESEPAA